MDGGNAHSGKVSAMVAAASLQSAWKYQVEDGRQLISCAIFVKFKMRHCKLYVWA